MNETNIKDNNDNLVFTDYLISTMEKIFDPIPVGIILVDNKSRIKMINNVFADYLRYDKEHIINKHVWDIDKNSRFPYVLKSKKAEIAWKHKFENGYTAIVHRIPVLDENNGVKYGVGMLLFQDLKEFREIIKQNKLLESELFHVKKQLKKLHGAKYSWDSIVGSSEKMIQAKYMGRRIAQTNSNVLILGESGTGKELFAHAIHNDSGRSHFPFVKVNCAAIPSNLLESELFGYAEGAFTGALKGGKIGKFELANGGSIFLDEIGDMHLDMQVKILRVLQEREFEKVGGNKPIKVDIRIIAATNKNLRELVNQGKFREDLYYRLNVMAIELPSLKERDGDIEGLSYLLLKKLSNQLGKYVTTISQESMNYLKTYNWPGNVRELENILERAINLAESDTILPMHLPLYITQNTVRVNDGPIRHLSEIIEEAEKVAIVRCLEYTKGNKLRTAKLLNISRSSLYDKIEKYNLV